MPDWALPASGNRGNRTNPSKFLPCCENGVVNKHVAALRSIFAFHIINKGDYKL